MWKFSDRATQGLPIRDAIPRTEPSRRKEVEIKRKHLSTLEVHNVNGGKNFHGR
jgi:hypothetical protein